MKLYRKFFKYSILYIVGFVVSISAYIIYANHYINPRLSKEIDKMIFAKYTFTGTDSLQVNLHTTYDGKVRLIDFWTLNCSFCTDDLEKFYSLDLQQNQNFLILAINRDELERWNSYLTENNLINKNPQIVHFNLSDKSILSKLEIEFYPTYFMLDEEGVIRSRCSYNFVTSKIKRVLTNETYFKDYLYDVYKYFPCGGLGKPTLVYSLIIYPILLMAYYFLIIKRNIKPS